MNRADQEQLYHQIIKYKMCRAKKRKIEIRNNIYNSLHAQMLKWVGAALTNIKWVGERENITCWAWDCFVFCIDSFDHTKKIDAVHHFYIYTEYYLRMQRNKSIKENMKHGGSGDGYVIKTDVDIDFIRSGLLMQHSGKNMSDLINISHDVEQFRKALDEKYQLIFDDALMSMTPDKRFRLRRQKEIGIPSTRYMEAKNIFKHVIRFFLGIRSF